ncbi:S8 family peptidase [Vannielia litorea]|uniref:S8 family peptidase n=1 Tax=Vannielia litorea TaxID=1217970 RepID=UPI0009418298|nr:S8 family peptidase [Vannielia litorea]
MSARSVLWRTVAVFLMPLALAGCGGGGGDDDDTSGSGGGSSSSSSSSGGTGSSGSSGGSGSSILASYFVESFEAFRTAAQQRINSNPRYLRQQNTWYTDDDNSGGLSAGDRTYSTYPLKSSGVYWAHAAGLTGAGQIIGIIDDGLLAAHEAFAGKSVSTAAGSGVGDHGTTVASVAAGDSSYMIGMAPGADLAFGSYNTHTTRAAGTRLAESLGAVALNNSWGFVNTPVTTTNFNAVFAGTAGQDYLAALRSYSSQGVVIFAASNDETDTRADLMAALPHLQPDLEPGWLAVINGAVTMSGDDIIAAERISAPCLEAAAWCLAAEGTWVGATATSTSSYELNTGTSFAAPMVAGAMAILAEAFPDMSPHDLRIRLLASADNQFAGFTASGSVELVEGFTHDISDEWGHGFLDVQAALLPIGPTVASMADGSSHDLSEPLVIEGAATGDAVARALRGVTLAASDALDAPFAIAAETLAARRAPTSLATRRQREWRQNDHLECCATAEWFDTSRTLSLSQHDSFLRLALPDDSDEAGSFGMTLGRAFSGDVVDVSLRLTLGRDEGDLLPSWYSGGGNTIVAAELGLGTQISRQSRIELSASLGAGFANGNTDGVSSGTARLNAASAALVSRDVFQRDDRLTLRIGMPVAVTGGSTNVTLPVATRSGITSFQDIEIDLAPSHRETRFGVEYEVNVAQGTDMVFAAMHAENFGNVSGQRNTGVFLGLRSRF